MIIIITGKAGAGKTTLRKLLLEKFTLFLMFCVAPKMADFGRKKSPLFNELFFIFLQNRLQFIDFFCPFHQLRHRHLTGHFFNGL